MSEQGFNDEAMEEVRGLVSSMFKDEQGRPIVLTDGQCEIFDMIFRKRYPRNHLNCFTRYGKSLAVGLAILARISTFPEKWCIAAGNDKQAGIIMSYIIQHIFDNEYIRQRFVMERGETAESIRRYRNRNRINFRLDGGLIGEVFITNAKGALGFGAPNVVEDESALISDEEEALIVRMLGDSPHENFLLKIGNPWDSGHFRASAEDPKYKKLTIDYKRGILEGRFTLEQAEEMRKKPFWDVLYECKFPPLDKMDDGGWMPLLTKDQIDKAVIDEAGDGIGINRLGGDVAGGGKNFSVLVQRHTNYAQMIVHSNDPDTMNFAEAIINARAKRGIRSSDVFIDKVGIGKGVFDITARELQGVHGINAGDKLPPGSMDEQLYLNLRAAMFWRLREWVIAGGKLVKGDYSLDDTWYQLTKILYRKKLEGTRGKVQIMPKPDMLKRGIQSPDVADALALTFAHPDFTSMGPQSNEETAQDELFDKYGLFPKV